MVGGAAELAVATARLKREDHSRTRHDSHFSQWKVLIGSSDWEDYSQGKEGVQRYRVENLPKTSSPGLYELGIALLPSGLGRSAGKLDPHRFVVVYLGQADSVRTRLQQYGRSGAHLCRSDSFQKGNGCFEDIFARGFSIVYRWAPMENKADAQRIEAQLLNTFDYAWNRNSNGLRRRDDVLKKLEKAVSRTALTKFVRSILSSRQKQVGIKIKASRPLLQGNECANENYSFPWQIFKFNRTQPRLILERNVASAYTTICGVALDGGVICTRPPVEGRKRCADHKGMRIKMFIPTMGIGSEPQAGTKCSEFKDEKEFEGHGNSTKSGPVNLPTVWVDSPLSTAPSHICGFVLGDGSPCRRRTAQGRCDEHKGRKIHNKKSYETCAPGTDNQVVSQTVRPELNFDSICGVQLGDGYVCMMQPLWGRVRCEEHKGLRVNGLIPKLTARNQSCKSQVGLEVSDCDDSYSRTTSICGATTLDGSFCSRRVNGTGRCWQHKGLRSSEVRSYFNHCENSYDSGSISICGATTRNGSFCRRRVQGNGRCWQH